MKSLQKQLSIILNFKGDYMIHLLLRTAMFVTLIFSVAAISAQTTEVITVDSRGCIFVDDHIIAKKENLTRNIHQANKLPTPVLEPDAPWEKSNGRIYIAGSVRFNEELGKYEMWYNGSGTAYAVSNDGISWEKPILGICTYKGIENTNIVYAHGCQTVLFDKDEKDPQKRYKMLGAKKLNHIWGAYSPDGFNWTAYENEPIMPFGSEVINVIKDSKTGKYMAFVRPYPPKPVVKGMKGRRLMAVTTSDDFENWSPMEIIIVADEIDDEWTTNSQQRTEFYGMSGFEYANQYLGIIHVFKITKMYAKEDKKPFQSTYEGPIQSQLVHSRDGKIWHRFEDRTPILPTGPADYDAGCIMFMATEPIIYQDQIRHYYTAINTTHGGTLPPKRITIGMAWWRLDGYVSLDAGDEVAMLETVPLQLKGNKLLVNADVASGSLSVEICNLKGEPISGYEFANSETIKTDNVGHLVKWKEKLLVEFDGLVKLRFKMRNTQLYAFKVIE